MLLLLQTQLRPKLPQLPAWLCKGRCLLLDKTAGPALEPTLETKCSSRMRLPATVHVHKCPMLVCFNIWTFLHCVDHELKRKMTLMKGYVELTGIVTTI